MSRGPKRTFGGVAVVVGLSLLAPAASRAASIEHGWWWRANGGFAPAPATSPLPGNVSEPAPPLPPLDADDGLHVAALPDGATAVAAVRVDEALTSLTLRVAPNGDANGASAKLAACAAATTWEPVARGRWADKPVVACDVINGGGSVAGVRAEDGMSWTFPVAPLTTHGATDVVIVPLVDGEMAEGTTAPFELVFVPPAASDVVLAPAAGVTTESAGEGSTEHAVGVAASPEAIPPFAGAHTDDETVTVPVVNPALEEREQAPLLPAFVVRPPDAALSRALGALVVALGLGILLWERKRPVPPIVSLVHGSLPERTGLTDGKGA